MAATDAHAITALLQIGALCAAALSRGPDRQVKLVPRDCQRARLAAANLR